MKKTNHHPCKFFPKPFLSVQLTFSFSWTRIIRSPHHRWKQASNMKEEQQLQTLSKSLKLCHHDSSQNSNSARF